MSLNNIQFSDYLCQNLYAKNLIPTTESSKVNDKKIKIDSLGGNQKKILFLVSNSQDKFLNNEEMILLTNLITACQLSMEDIALVNYYSSGKINYKDLIDHFQPGKVLLFGVSATELDLPFVVPNFQIQSYSEKLFMSAPSIKELLNDKNLKKELWICLQKIFLKNK